MEDKVRFLPFLNLFVDTDCWHKLLTFIFDIDYWWLLTCLTEINCWHFDCLNSISTPPTIHHFCQYWRCLTSSPVTTSLVLPPTSSASFLTTSSFRWSWRSSSTTSAANPTIPGRFSRPPFRGYLKWGVSCVVQMKIQICKNTQRKYRNIGLAGVCFALVLMATLGLILVLIAVHRSF